MRINPLVTIIHCTHRNFLPPTAGSFLNQRGLKLSHTGILAEIVVPMHCSSETAGYIQLSFRIYSTYAEPSQRIPYITGRLECLS